MSRIKPALDDLFQSVNGRSESFEVLILDNGSTDGTREWLAALDSPTVRVVFNDANLGKGGSVKKGIALSKGEYVAIHDSDLEYRAADMWNVLDAARDDQAAMALGSRTLGGGASYHYFSYYWGLRCLTGVINILFRSRITDAGTAIKLLDGKLARSLKLVSTGFELDFELLVRVLRLGHRVTERRVAYYPRTRAEGKKLRAWRDGLLSLKVIVRDRILPRRYFLLEPPTEQVGG